MAEDKCSLFDLPPEVVEEIVLSPVLSLRDICSLCRVNWSLHDLVNRLWAKIAAARWHYWGDCAGSSREEWYQLCKHRHLCEIHTHKIINQLTKKCMRVFLTDDDDLEGFSEFQERGIGSPQLIQCVLMEILRKPLSEADLTHQFYSLYAIEYVVRQGVQQQWAELLQLPDDQQLLERGAVLLSQWMNPLRRIRPEDTYRQLDSIAEKVACELLRRHGDGDTHGSPPECSRLESEGDDHAALVKVLEMKLPTMLVLDGMNTVLYDQLDFKPGSLQRYYDLENSYIDKVLERKIGIPVTLSVVYQAVARRLGVTVQVVNFPSHFLLRLPGDQPGQKSPVLIDAYARGCRRTDQECLGMIPPLDPVYPPDIFDAAEPIQVFIRMVSNIYNHSRMIAGHDIEREYDEEVGQWGSIAFTSSLILQLKLSSMMSDASFARQSSLYVALMCTEISFSTQMVERMLSDILARAPSGGGGRYSEMNADLVMLIQKARAATDSKRKSAAAAHKVKERKDSMCWKVGMVMKHRRYDYRCVIYGWDYKCEMSDGWVLQMGVNLLSRGRHQPFYNVLVADGSNRYASQESLFPCPAPELIPITHWEIGKYFSKFAGDKYIPNFALRDKYLYDS